MEKPNQNVFNSEEYNEKIEDGEKELKRNNLEAAWDCFFSAYTMKLDYFKSKKIKVKNTQDHDFLKVCYLLSEVVRNTKADSSFMKKIIKEDEDLSKNGYKGEKARKFVGRKYLKMAADAEYSDAVIEYALSCMGYGKEGSFTFECNEQNSNTALYWANNIMKKSADDLVKAMGYCIIGIYHLEKYSENSSKEDLFVFADNIVKASEIYPEFNEYIAYYLSYVKDFSELQDYMDGEYFSVKEGYELLRQVLKLGEDPYLLKSSARLISKIETSYPNLVE